MENVNRKLKKTENMLMMRKKELKEKTKIPKF